MSLIRSTIASNNRTLIFFIVIIALAVTGVIASVFVKNRTSLREVVPLPNGFQPEGIAAGEGSTFFVGSTATGAVYRGDLKTGKGAILVHAQDGRRSLGVKWDPRTNLLFVAGGETGKAFVYDGASGGNIAELQLTTQPSFINDLVITADAVYFTDSYASVLYKVLLDPQTGLLPKPPTFQAINLGGDYVFVHEKFNANGIEALPDGKTLIIVNSTTGILYRLDPATGVTTRIPLGTQSVRNGDGILLKDNLLYVVQNTFNRVAVVKLSPDYSSGEIVSQITSPGFGLPTTIAGFGNILYVVNAHFDTTPTQSTEYEVVRVPEWKD